MKGLKESQDDKKRTPSASFIVGSIALVFLIIGYQIAMFIHHAAVEKIVANHDHPDTVFVYSEALEGRGAHSTQEMLNQVQHDRNYTAREKDRNNNEPNSESNSRRTISEPTYIRKNAGHSGRAEAIRLANTPRRFESFRFNPNTASIDDLMRLGFTQKQAQSIDNYRQKGGRFRRKSDFAKSYVVEDSVYQRLEPYIDIPRIDLNTADSATFETLPGIGKYFASKMVSYRKELGGYSYPEQLMDIWHFDQEKYDGLKDLIFINPSSTTPYPLWKLPEEQLAKHPYIGKYSAHAIVIFRDNTPHEQWSVEALSKAGILKPENAEKLSRCLIAE